VYVYVHALPSLGYTEHTRLPQCVPQQAPHACATVPLSTQLGIGVVSCCVLCCSHWLPSCTGHLAQVTSLELSGPVTDHALGQLPGLFPGLLRLTVDSSYFAR
jgi:hypothetical protein